MAFGLLKLMSEVFLNRSLNLEELLLLIYCNKEEESKMALVACFLYAYIYIYIWFL
jgi:hypothetical protein